MLFETLHLLRVCWEFLSGIWLPTFFLCYVFLFELLFFDIAHVLMVCLDGC